MEVMLVGIAGVIVVVVARVLVGVAKVEVVSVVEEVELIVAGVVKFMLVGTVGVEVVLVVVARIEMLIRIRAPWQSALEFWAWTVRLCTRLRMKFTPGLPDVGMKTRPSVWSTVNIPSSLPSMMLYTYLQQNKSK